MERRVTPAARKPARSPSSSGPGLASSVTSASAARPKSLVDASRSRSDLRGREQRGRATAQVDAAERHRRGPAAVPRRQQVGPQVELAEDRLEQLGHAIAADRGQRRPPRPRSRSTDRARRRTGSGRRAPRAAGPRRQGRCRGAVPRWHGRSQRRRGRAPTGSPTSGRTDGAAPATPVVGLAPRVDERGGMIQARVARGPRPVGSATGDGRGRGPGSPSS